MFQLHVIHFDNLHCKIGDELGPDQHHPICLAGPLFPWVQRFSFMTTKSPFDVQTNINQILVNEKWQIKKILKTYVCINSTEIESFFIYIYLFVYSTLHIYFLFISGCSELISALKTASYFLILHFAYLIQTPVLYNEVCPSLDFTRHNSQHICRTLFNISNSNGWNRRGRRWGCI